jgi:hypothetical protein
MPIMEFAGFRLDTINLCVWRRGNVGEDERTALTPKAFDVLRYLVEHAGWLVTQDEILSALWPESYVNPEVLKHHVLEVRKALGDDPRNPRFIETMPRRGYRFIAPVSAVPVRRKGVVGDTRLRGTGGRLARACNGRGALRSREEPGIGGTSPRFEPSNDLELGGFPAAGKFAENDVSFFTDRCADHRLGGL